MRGWAQGIQEFDGVDGSIPRNSGGGPGYPVQSISDEATFPAHAGVSPVLPSGTVVIDDLPAYAGVVRAPRRKGPSRRFGLKPVFERDPFYWSDQGDHGPCHSLA